MNKVGLNEKIRNRIGRNLYYMSCVVTNDNVRTEFEKNNELLDAIFVEMKQDKSSEDYEKGLNDAWDLAQKIGGSTHPGFYDGDELDNIFGWGISMDIFDRYSYSEALAKIEEYEKKKAEEAAKPVRGDIVRFSIGSSVYNAIFLCENQREQYYWVLRENEEFPQRLSKENFSLIKTGKHVDLDGLFKEINND